MEEKGLVVRKENLPATIDELKEFVIVTKRRIEAHKAQISAIERLGLSKSVYERKLKETQYMSGIVLWAEAKMGSLLKKIPLAKGVGGGRGKKKLTPTDGNKLTEIQKTGIKHSDRSRAQMLNNNRDAIQEVIDEETNKRNIPTREKVFRKIRENKLEVFRSTIKKQAKKYKAKGNMPKVICTDFYGYCMKNIKPSSIDHIITDPPYSEKFLYLWDQLSEVAERVLKPGGFCIAYTGVYYLPDVLDRMRKHLIYYWQLTMKLIGAHAKVYNRNIFQVYRSILIFSKKPIKKQSVMTMDFFEHKEERREKDLHEEQQMKSGFVELLNKFTIPGQMILEPFGGAGTVPVVCLEEGRKCLCIEIKEENVKIIKGRLNIAYKELNKTK